MSQDTNVMVDIETLGKGPGCAILSIGAVAFDPLTGAINSERGFYVEVSKASCEAAGLTTRLGTLRWWMEQGDLARALLFRTEGDSAVALEYALRGLNNWLAGVGHRKGLQLWANDPQFDCAILKEAYCRFAGLPVPWNWRNERSCRTVVHAGKILGTENFKRNNPFEGIVHHALHDAEHQAKYVCDYVRAFREL